MQIFTAKSQGEAFVALLLSSHEWKHRRVDSVHLESGDQGRWKTSLDCTIPNDPRLAYKNSPDQVVIPLAFVDKEPMRDLDVTDGSGEPLPVLGIAENAALAVEMLSFAFRTDGIVVTPEIRAVFESIILGHTRFQTSERTPTETAQLLLSRTSTGEASILSNEQLNSISEVSAALLEDLARSFLLAVVVPSSRVGVRQVIKMSHYWHTDLQEFEKWPTIMLGAFGLKRIGIEIPVRGAGDAASYHLELHTPPEVVSEGLGLPLSSRSIIGIIDDGVTSVAHAHGNYQLRADYEEGPGLVAWLSLGVTRKGTKSVTFLTSVFTFLFFLFGITLPGALSQLRGEGSAAGAADPSALLLTLPAVAVGLFVSTREHALASVLLLPLRTASIISSALLLIASAALTFQLRDPFLVPLWLLSLGISGVTLTAVVTGELFRSRRNSVRGLQ